MCAKALYMKSAGLPPILNMDPVSRATTRTRAGLSSALVSTPHVPHLSLELGQKSELTPNMRNVPLVRAMVTAASTATAAGR